MNPKLVIFLLALALAALVVCASVDYAHASGCTTILGLIAMRPTRYRAIDVTGVKEANREDADQQIGSNLFRGAIIALAFELAICLAGYFILHVWRLM